MTAVVSIIVLLKAVSMLFLIMSIMEAVPLILKISFIILAPNKEIDSKLDLNELTNFPNIYSTSFPSSITSVM